MTSSDSSHGSSFIETDLPTVPEGSHNSLAPVAHSPELMAGRSYSIVDYKYTKDGNVDDSLYSHASRPYSFYSTSNTTELHEYDDVVRGSYSNDEIGMYGDRVTSYTQPQGKDTNNLFDFRTQGVDASKHTETGHRDKTGEGDSSADRWINKQDSPTSKDMYVAQTQPTSSEGLSDVEDDVELMRFQTVDLRTIYTCELCKTKIANEVLMLPCKCPECAEAYVHPTCLTSMREAVKARCYNTCKCSKDGIGIARTEGDLSAAGANEVTIKGKKIIRAISIPTERSHSDGGRAVAGTRSNRRRRSLTTKKLMSTIGGTPKFLKESISQGILGVGVNMDSGSGGSRSVRASASESGSGGMHKNARVSPNIEPSIASSKGLAFTVSMYTAYSPAQTQAKVNHGWGNKPSDKWQEREWKASHSFDSLYTKGGANIGVDAGASIRKSSSQRQGHKNSFDGNSSASYTARGAGVSNGPTRRYTPQYTHKAYQEREPPFASNNSTTVGNYTTSPSNFQTHSHKRAPVSQTQIRERSRSVSRSPVPTSGRSLHTTPTAPLPLCRRTPPLLRTTTQASQGATAKLVIYSQKQQNPGQISSARLPASLSKGGISGLQGRSSPILSLLSIKDSLIELDVESGECDSNVRDIEGQDSGQRRSGIHAHKKGVADQLAGLPPRSISMNDLSYNHGQCLPVLPMSTRKHEALSKRHICSDPNVTYLHGLSVEALKSKIRALQTDLEARSLDLIEHQQEREELRLRADTLQIQAHKICRETLNAAKQPS
eukprot:CFRG4571T1